MKSSQNKTEQKSISAILLCAGSGTRTGLNYNKLLYYIGKKTLLETTLDRIQASRVQSTLVIAAKEDYQNISEILKGFDNVSITLGGETRTESVRCGLNELGHCDIVVIHDGARPYVTPDIINASIDSAIKYGSGILCVPTVDTIKEITSNEVVRTLSRAGLFNIQTPQTFRYDEISDAYNKCTGVFNDDSEVYERAGYSPKLVRGDYKNVKVTTMEDLYRVNTQRIKIGIGFDVHQLVKGRKLILGGVDIPHDKGLKGHSDADVLTHSIMDALLSAAELPDIGVLFPDNNPAYKDVSSLKLLMTVINTITARGFSINNISSVIMAEKPKLAQIIPEMRVKLAMTMNIPEDRINISSTTTEQLGIIGNEKGIAASSTCLLNY